MIQPNVESESINKPIISFILTGKTASNNASFSARSERKTSGFDMTVARLYNHDRDDVDFLLS